MYFVLRGTQCWYGSTRTYYSVPLPPSGRSTKKNCALTPVASTRSGRRPTVEALGIREGGKQVRITTLGGSSVFKDRAPRPLLKEEVPVDFSRCVFRMEEVILACLGLVTAKANPKAWGERISTSNRWLFWSAPVVYNRGHHQQTLAPDWPSLPISAAGLHDGIH